MNKTFGISLLLISTASATLIAMPVAQPPGGFGPGGPGRGGPGGPGQREEQKLVKQFDQDDNGWLNTAERKMARDAVDLAEVGRVDEDLHQNPGSPVPQCLSRTWQLMRTSRCMTPAC